VGLVAALALAGGPAAAEEDGEAKPITLAVFSNMGSFKASGANADGTQNIGYFQLIYATRDWGIGATSAYAATDYVSTLSKERLKRSGMTDASIVTYYNHRAGDFMARCGVDVSIPTGKASQTSKDLTKNIADDINQDLLLINSYGSGLNVAGHLALSYKTGALTWGMGLRYLVAGAYDPMSDKEKDIFDPGDSLLAMASALYNVSPEDRALLNFSRTMQGKDKQDGKAIYRNGDVSSAELRYMRDWADGLMTTLILAARQQDKNERLYSGDQYKTETGNSNANTTEAGLEMAWKQSSNLLLTGAGGYKSAKANGYQVKDYLYDGGRTRWFIEPGVRWTFYNDLLLSLKARYTEIKDNKDYFSPNGATYKVNNVDLGLIMGF
jgi:hypothetical protein